MGGARTPRLLYRVGADGKRAAGARRGISTTSTSAPCAPASKPPARTCSSANFFGDPPVTVLAPALLFDDATVRRANEKNEKLPFYPPPE